MKTKISIVHNNSNIPEIIKPSLFKPLKNGTNPIKRRVSQEKPMGQILTLFEIGCSRCICLNASTFSTSEL
jgi:hypothetical protein